MSLIARLIEAGTPAELVEEVAMLIAEQRVLEKRRANDRERQQAKRVRDKDECHVMSRDVTQCHNDTSLSLPPNEINSNPPTHTHPVNTPCARKADPFPKPEWADPQVWADWMDVRRAKKARNTPTAYAGFIRSIAEQQTDEWPPGRLLAHAVENSWKSIHRPEEHRNERPTQNLRQGSGPGPDRRSGFARAIDNELARSEVFPFP